MVNGVGKCRKTMWPRRLRNIERQRKRYGGSPTISGLTPAEATSSVPWRMALSGWRCAWKQLWQWVRRPTGNKKAPDRARLFSQRGCPEVLSQVVCLAVALIGHMAKGIADTGDQSGEAAQFNRGQPQELDRLSHNLDIVSHSREWRNSDQPALT